MRLNDLKLTSISKGWKLAAALLFLAALCAPHLWAQSTLQITSPAAGTVVNPGQVLTVSVSISGTFQQIAIIGEGPIGLSQVLSSAPYQFSLQIPTSLPARSYQLTAAGMISQGQVVYSDPVSITVEPASAPTLVNVQTPSLDFGVVGDQIPLRVVGTMSDGSTMDLTRSASTTYSSDTPSVATVSSSGVVTAVSPGKCRIIVNGAWDVSVTVEQPISVAPRSSVLHPSQSQQMVATVHNAANNTAVAWALRSGDPGTINSAGLYSAPSSISSQTSAQVTATSVEDSTKSASSILSLYPAVSVTVAPSSATVKAGSSQQFSAAVANAVNTGVSWYISPAVGTITSTGLYTAPTSVSTTQTVTVTATSIEDPTKTASATVTVRK
jgi:hypothetical protein